MQQIELFVDMSELEQRVQLSGHLPFVESYGRRSRLFAIHEYVPSPPS